MTEQPLTEKPLRTVHVTVPRVMDMDRARQQIERYLPRAYWVAGTASNLEFGDGIVIVNGKDEAGWTAEDYVVPRLQSGMWAAEIVR